jgi:hypothetical protein
MLRQVCSTASSGISSGAPQNRLAGDIAQKIDPPEIAVELCEHAADVLRLGDIAGHRHGAAAEFFNLARGLFQPGKAPARQHQIRPGFGQGDGHGAAHAASGS